MEGGEEGRSGGGDGSEDMPVDARGKKTRLGPVPPHALEKKKISLSAATMMTFVVCASKGTTKKKKGEMSRSRRIGGFVRRRGPLAAHPG